MPSKELTAFRVAPELMDALRQIKTTEGIPISTQVDFALRDWISKKQPPKRPAAGRKARRG